MIAIGYVRGSTDEQEVTLLAQRHKIEEEAARRGWELRGTYMDQGSTGKNMERPGLEHALYHVGSGAAQVLMVTKLDRLTRSIADFSTIVKTARDQDWSLCITDMDIDTSTPTGKLVANVIMAVAEWEVEIIGVRTKEALAEKRNQGVLLGGAAHKRRIPDEAREFANDLRYNNPAGLTPYSEIMRELNDRYPGQTLNGGPWTKSTVQYMLSPRPTNTT